MKNILICILLLFVGCKTTNKKIKRVFPANIEPQCYNRLNEAKSVIDTKGVHKVNPRSVVVQIIKGQKRFNEGWGWKIKHPNLSKEIYVLGLTLNNGTLVQIGSHPNNINDINFDTLFHEFMHHWLTSNGYRGGHYPIYDDVVNGWATSRAAVGSSFGMLTFDNPEKEIDVNDIYVGYNKGDVVGITIINGDDIIMFDLVVP